MRAITLWQPWASLIAEGVKTIETRPKRAPWSSAIGETIAIHAAFSLEGLRSIEFDYEDGWAVGSIPGDESHVFAWQRIDGRLVVQLYVDGVGPFDVPLGAVVATCTLVDVVPMTAPFDPCIDNYGQWIPHVTCGDVLRYWPTDLDEPTPPVEIEDQRPFGDFAPGRWALLLDNIERLPEPIPCRGYQGLWRVDLNVEALIRDGIASRLR